MSNKMVGKGDNMDAQKNIKKEQQTPEKPKVGSSPAGGVPSLASSAGARRGGPGQAGGGGPGGQRGHGPGRGPGHSGPGMKREYNSGNEFEQRNQFRNNQNNEGDFRGGRGGGRGEDFGFRDDFGNSRGRGMGRGRGGGSGMRRGDRNFQLDKPQISMEEAMPDPNKKFSGRCRLFVGNLPSNFTEDDFTNMFKEHGEYEEVFLNNQKCFGFIRMDLRKNALAAKDAIDGLQLKGRTLRVRFAAHAASLKVKYLPQHVTNELLAQAFSIFGELERAVVIVDDRGKPTGDGVVDFVRKPGAQAAMKRIAEGVFLMGTSPRPITVEPFEQKDEDDGYAEKFIHKNIEVNKEREQGPRFAPPGSFEFEFGQKWKDLFRIHEEQKVNLQMEFEAAASKLDIEQAGAEMEHQRLLLRQDLIRRQEELRRLEETHQMQLQKRLDMKQEEERRRQEEMHMREEMMNRKRQQNMQPPPAPPACLGVLESGRGNAGQHRGMGGGHGDMEEDDNNFGRGGHEDFHNERQGRQMRQSRFDQPPEYNQGHMGVGNGNMGSDNRGMGQQRREDHGMSEEYLHGKRPRRY